MGLTWVGDYVNGKYRYIITTAATVVAVYGIYRMWQYWCFQDEYFETIRKISTKPTKSKQILVIGLDGSGKTCFLKSFGETRKLSFKPQPSDGLNVATRTIGDAEYRLYEVGTFSGLIRARLVWTHILKKLKINTVVMVIDASDHFRSVEAKAALAQFSEENNTENIQLLILANKQDVPGALTPQQVYNRVVQNKYKYRRVDVIGTVMGPGKIRSGVYNAYRYLYAE